MVKLLPSVRSVVSIFGWQVVEVRYGGKADGGVNGMTPHGLRRDGFRRIICLLAVTLVMLVSPLAEAQPGGGVTFEQTMPPGNNYDKAAFRLWYPEAAPPIEAVVVLMPGSNDDGRTMVDDPVWRDFASQHKLALLGCEFTDKPHEQAFIEAYANVSQGSGQALLEALAGLAKTSGHPELAQAPLLLWGMSAGGEFNYEFVAWKPERVAAFVVNKGGIYYSALTSAAARGVPGLLFIGGADLPSRQAIITGLFALNRRAGALWALSEEPGAAHIVGRSRDLALWFFADVLSLRLVPPKAGEAFTLKPLAERDGWVGDRNSKNVQPAKRAAAGESSVWLPTERVARGWQAIETGKPFDP